jgi:hypothetical protein
VCRILSGSGGPAIKMCDEGLIVPPAVDLLAAVLVGEMGV